MSYRTYINDQQIFGNNECYSKWIEYIKSKGIEVDEDGCYDGYLDNFLEVSDIIEQIVFDIEDSFRERQKSIFDLSFMYDNVKNNLDTNSLLEEQILFFDAAYLTIPYNFYLACKKDLVFGDREIPKHFISWELKNGCRIHVHAG